MNRVLYICDRKRCNPCNNELCRHTTDIDHAVTFQKDKEGNYWECNEPGRPAEIEMDSDHREAASQR